MWYFSWVLGLGFAVTFAVLNAMWLEQRRELDEEEKLKKEEKLGGDR
jgi:cytochrome bd-I ubiquinol oxidase subunit X